MDTKQELSTNPFDEIPSTQHYNPFVEYTPPEEQQAQYNQLHEIAHNHIEPELMNHNENPLTFPGSNPFEGLKAENLISNRELIPAGSANLELILQERENFNKTHEKLANLTYLLQPSSSFWEMMAHYFKNTGLASKIAGYTLSGAAPAVLTALKVAGIFMTPSMIIGILYGLWGASLAVGALMNDYSAHAQDENESEVHLKKLGESVEIIFNQMKNIYEQLALENHLYRLELEKLSLSNMQFARINVSLNQELLLLGVTRNQLNTEVENLITERNSLQGCIQANEDRLQIIDAELAHNKKLMEENQAAFRIQNRKLELAANDMKLQKEQSQKIILELQNTLQKVANLKMQDVSDRKEIKEKMDNIFDISQNNMNKVYESMSLNLERFTKNMEIMEKNNQAVAETLIKDKAQMTLIDQILQQLNKPAESDSRMLKSIRALASVSFMKKPQETSVTNTAVTPRMIAF